MESITGTQYFFKNTNKDTISKILFCYFICASHWESPDSGIATIVSLTNNAPVLSDMNIIVQTGGPHNAFKQAVEQLRDLPELKSLETRGYLSEKSDVR